MIWYKHVLWFVVFFLFMLESSLIPWLVPSAAVELNLTFAAQFAFVLILYIAIYLNRHMALAMALVFGFMHDLIFYGHVLGAYTFGMSLVTYVISMMLRDSHISWYVGIGSIGLGLLSFDYLVYGLYRLFQITSVTPWWHFVHAALPSLLLNLCFTSALYYPVIRIFARIERYVAPDESDAYPTGNP